MKRFLLCLLIGLSTQAQSAKLAVIIDDLGNHYKSGLRTVMLKAPLNLAFLPQTPHAQSLSKASHKQGHLNMLHQPMASLSGAALGPGGLSSETKKQDYKAILERNLASIYQVKGVNNHMGSLLTQDKPAMAAFMPLVKEQKLFFIDSLTTANSLARSMAQQHKIPNHRRHVFLDHFKNTPFIDKQFKQAVRIAKKRGFAILIGHPYKPTLEYLEQALPSLYLQDVELVRLDTYLQGQKKQPKQFPVHPIFLFGIMQ